MCHNILALVFELRLAPHLLCFYKVCYNSKLVYLKLCRTDFSDTSYMPHKHLMYLELYMYLLLEFLTVQVAIFRNVSSKIYKTVYYGPLRISTGPG